MAQVEMDVFTKIVEETGESIKVIGLNGEKWISSADIAKLIGVERKDVSRFASQGANIDPSQRILLKDKDLAGQVKGQLGLSARGHGAWFYSPEIALEIVMAVGRNRVSTKVRRMAARVLIDVIKGRAVLTAGEDASPETRALSKLSQTLNDGREFNAQQAVYAIMNLQREVRNLQAWAFGVDRRGIR